MSFLDPLRLLLLAGLVPLVLAYRRGRHRPAAYSAVLPTARFAALAHERVGRRWRRLWAPLALLAATAALVVGFARPVVTVRVPAGTADVVLALDTSLSMYATDVEPSRLVAATKAAAEFVGQLPEDARIGVVLFDGNAELALPLSTDHAAVLAALRDVRQPQGGTAIGDAVAIAGSALSRGGARSGDAAGAAPQATPAPGRPARTATRVVLLSDGDNNAGRSVDAAAADLKRRGVAVDTIAFGTSEGTIVLNGRLVRAPVSDRSLQELADLTGGSTYSAESTEDLAAVYSDVAADVGYREEQREVTAWAGAAGAALLLLGVLLAAGMRRRSRRPVRSTAAGGG